MLRAVYGNDTLHLPASLLGTFLLLDCAVSAGLDLNGKSRASCLSSGAHLTSHRVSTGTARAASMAVDQCHSGTAETAPCWNPSEPWDLHRAGAVVGSTGIVFLHRRKALLPCWTLMYSRIAGEWFLRHFNEKAGGKEPPSCCGSYWGNLSYVTLHPPAMSSLLALNEAILRCLQAAALCYPLKSSTALGAETMFPASSPCPHLVALR